MTLPTERSLTLSSLIIGTKSREKTFWKWYASPDLFCFVSILTYSLQGGKGLLAYYDDSLPKALMQVYPSIALEAQKFKVAPSMSRNFGNVKTHTYFSRKLLEIIGES